MAITNREEWQNLLEEYRNLPQLWNITSSMYKNKNLRNKAWEILPQIYKKIEKNATIQELKRKINNVRTSYRRELKKILQSEKSGAGAEDVYVPSLWYFDLLDFLRDHEIPIDGTSTITDSENEEVSIIEHRGNLKRSRNKKNKENIENGKFLQKAVNYLDKQNNEKDDATIFAEGWACCFRKLSAEQQLYAKKIINETLLFGQLNQLSLNSSISATISTNSTAPSTSRSLTPSDNFEEPQYSDIGRPYIISNEPILFTPRQRPNGYKNFKELFNDVQYTQ